MTRIGDGDPRALGDLRAHLGEAERQIADACRVLRDMGWPETAGDLERLLRHVRTWTAPGGYIHHLEG